jgi:hypothetical protein
MEIEAPQRPQPPERVRDLARQLVTSQVKQQQIVEIAQLGGYVSLKEVST